MLQRGNFLLFLVEFYIFLNKLILIFPSLKQGKEIFIVALNRMKVSEIKEKKNFYIFILFNINNFHNEN